MGKDEFPGSFVSLDNARVDEQRRVMQKIVEAGDCPFCPEHLDKYHTQPILNTTENWILTYNQWPYENTRIHLLAILKSHAERLAELPEGAGDELLYLFAWAEHEYALQYGGFALRFGVPPFNGGTVRHLHAQLASINITDRSHPDYKAVRFPVGKGAK